MKAQGSPGMEPGTVLLPGACPPLQEGPLQVLRLQWLFAAVAHKFSASVCILQAWLPAKGTSAEDFTLHSEPRVAVVTDPRFAAFRLRSCHNPVQFRNSMTGRVWRTGATQVVQNLRLVPPTMHPRLYLSDADLDCLGEALYIPVYDSYRVGAGPITVLEALLPAHSQHPICSADLLSFISAGLATLKLSVSDPVAQPIRRSALCGRRARAPPDSAPDLQEVAGATSQTDGDSSSGANQPAEVAGVGTLTAVAKTISGPEPAIPPAISNGAAKVDQADLHTTASSRHHIAECEIAAGVAAVAVADVKDSLASVPAREEANTPETTKGRQDGDGKVLAVLCRSNDKCAPPVVVDGGELGEEWDSVPRKFRKLAGGMVRTQSSFHMAGPAPALTHSAIAPSSIR